MSVPIRMTGKFVFENEAEMSAALSTFQSEFFSESDLKLDGPSVSLNWEGSGPYRLFEDTTLALELLGQKAIGGSVETVLDGESLWYMATKPLGYHPDFDLVIRDVIACDWQGVELMRDRYRTDFATDVLKAYATLDWMQRSALIQVVQDTLDPTLKPIMVDFLKAPAAPEHDLIWLSKVTAFVQIEQTFDVWDDLYALGNAGVEAKAAAYLSTI